MCLSCVAVSKLGVKTPRWDTGGIWVWANMPPSTRVS